MRKNQSPTENSNHISDRFADTSRTISKEKTSSKFEKFNYHSNLIRYNIYTSQYIIKAKSISLHIDPFQLHIINTSKIRIKITIKIKYIRFRL